MKKILINSHIHSTGSDGKLTPKEIIELAIERRLDYICFTDHYKRRKIFYFLIKKVVDFYNNTVKINYIS